MALRNTVEEMVNHRGGGGGSVVANHRGGDGKSVVVTTLIFGELKLGIY